MDVNGGTTGANFGGLAGENDGGTISNSSANGSLTGDGRNGGLVGQNGGVISRCNADGAVSVTKGSGGGLVGWNGNYVGVISESYSSGSVSTSGTARANIGGLVGDNFASSISESYSTGSVTGGNKTWFGGFLGSNDYGGIVTQAYSTGAVASTAGKSIESVRLPSRAEVSSRGNPVPRLGMGHPGHLISEGGFVGYDDTKGSFADAYWDTDTSGITDPSQGAGNIPNDPGITGLSTQQLQSGLPNGFDPKIWAEKPNFNNGLPYLINNPPPK